MRLAVADVMNPAAWHTMRSYTRDSSVTHQRLKPGTVRRIASYARPYRGDLILFLIATSVDAVIIVAVPLLLRALIDNGIQRKDTEVVLAIAAVVAAIALFDAVLSVVQRWYSARIGEGLIYDLARRYSGTCSSSRSRSSPGRRPVPWSAG